MATVSDFRDWGGLLLKCPDNVEGEDDTTSYPFTVDKLCEIRGSERPSGRNKQAGVLLFARKS